MRDSEIVPLKEDVEEFFRGEVLPYRPDAWIDHDKTKIGYEISLNLHFYQYKPPRPLEEIETDLNMLGREILDLITEVTGNRESVQA